MVFAVADEDLYYNLEIAPSRAPEIDDSDVVEKELQEIEARGVIGVGISRPKLTLMVW